MRSPAISVLLLFLLCSLLSVIYLLSISLPRNSNPNPTDPRVRVRVRVLVADLPRSLNYGLLDRYWSLPSPDSRIPADPDSSLRRSAAVSPSSGPPPYPTNPLISQYSAEYWILGDLETPEPLRSESSVAVRVDGSDGYDVVLVPFFATLSAEMELGWGRKGGFGRKEGNGDFERQKEVVDRVVGSEAWKRTGGRDHVFILTGR